MSKLSEVRKVTEFFAEPKRKGVMDGIPQSVNVCSTCTRTADNTHELFLNCHPWQLTNCREELSPPIPTTTRLIQKKLGLHSSHKQGTRREARHVLASLNKQQADYLFPHPISVLARICNSTSTNFTSLDKVLKSNPANFHTFINLDCQRSGSPSESTWYHTQ